MRKIIAMILVLGLGLGCGLAYLLESLDTSFKTPDDLEKELQIPVLVSMPIRYTEEEVKGQKRMGILKAASVSVGFVLCATAVIVATKGTDTTVNYVKTTLTNLGVL